MSATLALALTAPGQTAGISVFTDPLITDLDISRTQLSTAYLVATLAGAACLPLVGRAIDRYGVRGLVTASAVLLGTVLVGCSFVGSLPGLTVGFVGLRLTGQGALGLLASTTVALWFDRGRGTALGVMSALGSAGISLAPILTERLIAATDWRTAWLVQGLTIWAVLIPVGLLGLRGRPPRPAPQRHAAEGDGRHGDRDTGWTVGAAMRTAAFWTIIAAVCCQGLLTTAVAFHQVSLLGEHGLSPTEAAANFLPQTLAGLVAAFALGSLSDRVAPRIVLAASMAGLAAGLLCVPLIGPGLSAVGFGMLIGASANGIRTLEASIVPAYFGTGHLGALRGVVHAATVASTAFGPILLSLAHDLAGSYTPALTISAAAPILIGIAVLLLRPPAPISPNDASSHRETTPDHTPGDPGGRETRR